MQSQVARLKAAKVNTLMVFATPLFTIQSYVYAHKLGWKPRVYVNAVSSAANIMGLAKAGAGQKQVEGTISIVFLKDPTDAHWAKDPGMKLYRSIMKRYKGGNPNDVYAVYGMSVAHTFVAALKKAGKNPTRAGIMKAATSLNVTNDPFLLPGIAVKTSGRPLPARPVEAPALPQRALGLVRRAVPRQVASAGSPAGSFTSSRRLTGSRLITVTVSATPTHCVQRSDESKT